jgi:hypothetical protein
MKIAPSKDNSSTKRTPILPLVPETIEKTKVNSVQFEIPFDPADNNSKKYKKNILILKGGEDVRTIIDWLSDFYLVKTGLALGDPNVEVTAYKSFMTGSALTIFDEHLLVEQEIRRQAAIAAATTAANKRAERERPMSHWTTSEIVQEAIEKTAADLSPKNALAKAKRYLRRECRKPADMRIREFYQHVIRMNTHEFPLLSPFEESNSMNNDELNDIFLHATPNKWQREMDRQGFDPMDKTPIEVITFMEQIETAEEAEPRKDPPTKKNKKGSHSKESGSTKEKKYCEIHGLGSHTTAECRSKKSGNSSGGDKKKFSNKTWSKKAADAKAEVKAEMNAFITKAVANGVRKELAAISKKRKAAAEDSLDLNAFDVMEGDLDGFNYEDMEKMDLSDGEVSDESFSTAHEALDED